MAVKWVVIAEIHCNFIDVVVFVCQSCCQENLWGPLKQMTTSDDRQYNHSELWTRIPL